MNGIERRIDSVKFLINRDKLIVPGEKEEDIFELVSRILLNTKKTKVSSFKVSTLDNELSKAFNNLKFYFKDKDIIKRYNDIVINRHVIKQCLCKGEYSTSFAGPQLVWDINLPYELDELSHVFIGHEIIHALSINHNYREWEYTLLYSEVISMLYELIQADNKDSKKRKGIVNFRLNKLDEMYNVAFNENALRMLQDDEMDLKYYQIPNKIYFISFYYTILIYMLYKDDPKRILNMIKKVLKQENTTLEMLEQLNIVGDIKSKDFEEGFKLALK